MILCDEVTRVKALNGKQVPARRVCFVCTGNTCRSPMAEAVANALAAESRRAVPESMRDCATPPPTFCSAGLFAREGDPITPNAVLALGAASVPPVPEHDYRTHTAHALTDEDANACDLLVGMSGQHVIELTIRYPHLTTRIVCMPVPIPDPFGGDVECYRACLCEIEAGVRRLLFEGDV